MKTTIIKKKITKEDIGKHGYIPVHDSDIEFCMKQVEGQIMISDIKRDRYYPLTQKYFATCNLVAQNKKAFEELEQLDTKKKVDDYIKLKTGLVEYRKVFVNSKGENVVIIKNKSLSNANMDKAEFQDFFNKAIEVLSWMSGISIHDLTLNWANYENGIGD